MEKQKYTWSLCALIIQFVFVAAGYSQEHVFGLQGGSDSSSSESRKNLVSQLEKNRPKDKGAFAIFQIEGKKLLYVPDAVLKKDLALTTTILKAPAMQKRSLKKKYGYAGDAFGPILLRFKKEGQSMWLTDPLYDRDLSSPAWNPIVEIARQRGEERLYESFPILAKLDGGSVIDITSWLDDSPLLNLEIVNFEIGIGPLDKSACRLNKIKASNHSILMEKRVAYQPSIAPTGASHATQWEIGICLSLLPEPSLSLTPGIDDYFYVSHQNFDTDPYQAVARRTIKRWRLELTPQDSVRYFRGELVEPVTPIVFYIDRHTPKRWIPCIMESVSAWQVAFEQAGFKNAIQARMEPDPQENPRFCMYDSRNGYISWKTSGISNAYGPTPCLAGNGEVIGCHIGIFSSVLDQVQNWYFTQCGATDSVAWKIHYPTYLMEELMKMVFTHEIGHTLGLKHNFYGSSLFSLEQLRDDDFLSRNGMGTSIMDYMRCNYALRPTDKVQLKNRIARIGEYDKWAIEYGYRIFPGKNEQEREQARRLWMGKDRKESNRFLDMFDVRAQAEDLGNDHVLFNTQGVENLKYLCRQEGIWTVSGPVELQVLQGRYLWMITSLEEWTKQVLSHLGGKYVDGDGFRPEEAGYCRKVVDFLGQYVLEPPVWLFNAGLTEPLELDDVEQYKRFYEQMIPCVTERFKAVARLEHTGHPGVYTLKEYVDSLHDIIFSEWKKNVSAGDMKFFVQLCYVKNLQSFLKHREGTSPHLLVVVWNELERIKSEACARKARLASSGKDYGQVMELINLLED